MIALAFIAAWASSDLVTATLLPLIMMVGHILEERSLLGSQEAIRALSRLTENTARRIRDDGGIEEIAGTMLRTGDRIEVRAGDRIPGDGLVENGVSSVDTSSITGESVPADVQPGSLVFNGSINLEGVLAIRVTGVGGESTLGRRRRPRVRFAADAGDTYSQNAFQIDRAVSGNACCTSTGTGLHR